MNIRIKVLASSSKGNCYLIDDGETILLLEAGIPHKEIQRLSNYQLHATAGVLITHEHKDHSKAIEDLIKKGIDCYLTEGTMKALCLNKSGSNRLKTIKAAEQFEIGSWTILPFETEHDAAEPVGFLMQSRNGGKVLFATDTYYIKYRFNGLTHIMIECNYSSAILSENVKSGHIPQFMKNRLIKSHFSLENLKKFFQANDLKQVQEIYLLHLSSGNSDADLFQKEIAKITGKLVHVAQP